ncbi:MAG: hypothetical protein KAT65_24490 [Methanophagales archaeon]|nr:hypothetical protein [Methanophagales archaeon]
MHSNDTSKRTVDYTLFRSKEKVRDRDKRKGCQQTPRMHPISIGCGTVGA